MPRKIVVFGHPALRKKASPVERKDFGSEELLKIIRDMSEALSATPDGIGIAAPQIGVPLQIFIASEEALAIDRGGDVNQNEKKRWKHHIFINPEILKKSAKKSKMTEGCLSVPGKCGVVARAEKIRVRAFDEHGKKFERGASNLFARLIQHELDHLDGILYVDKAESIIDADAKK